MVLFLLLLIAFIILISRNYSGNNLGKYVIQQASNIYSKYAPYSFKVVREKTKQLGKEFTVKDYLIQIAIFSVATGVITYMYFYSVTITIIYVCIVIAFIPYLSYLRCKKVYSEFIFEQIQTYTSNTIMEFATTQSFVKSLEGVRDSGILEDPVKSDVEHMIELAYQNGTIDESVNYMSNLYPYFIVKNMHQLFLQITKEGARDSGESLENMSLDIDSLVEGVYRDQMDRKNFHKRFLSFGMILFFLIIALQFMLGVDNYLELLETWYVQIILHVIILLNAYFLLSGEKYYNEDVGVE